MQRSRLGRFFTLSTALHVLGAACAVWLSVSLFPRPDEQLVVRTIDFVDPGPAPRASAPPLGEPKASADKAGGPTVPAPARARVAATPRAASPPSRPAAPKAEVMTPKTEPKAEITPTPPPPPPPPPSPEEQRIAAAMPRSVGAATPTNRAPASVAVPTRETPTPGAAGESSTVAVAVPGVGGTGPVATVAIPSAIARTAGTGTGSSGGGSGTGVGSGTGSAGARDGVADGRGGGTGAVDLRDPDFSEYFRLIERRVREVWKFPDGLGGTTQTVKIGFALGPEGSLREVKVVSSSAGTLNDSALAAMKRAAPFPPLPEKFRKLAGQPLVMSFTVTIR